MDARNSKIQAPCSNILNPVFIRLDANYLFYMFMFNKGRVALFMGINFVFFKNFNAKRIKGKQVEEFAKKTRQEKRKKNLKNETK